MVTVLLIILFLGNVSWISMEFTHVSLF
jgi:hypothetical protein